MLAAIGIILALVCLCAIAMRDAENSMRQEKIAFVRDVKLEVERNFMKNPRCPVCGGCSLDSNSNRPSMKNRILGYDYGFYCLDCGNGAFSLGLSHGSMYSHLFSHIPDTVLMAVHEGLYNLPIIKECDKSQLTPRFIDDAKKRAETECCQLLEEG